MKNLILVVLCVLVSVSVIGQKDSRGYSSKVVKGFTIKKYYDNYKKLVVFDFDVLVKEGEKYSDSQNMGSRVLVDLINNEVVIEIEDGDRGVVRASFIFERMMYDRSNSKTTFESKQNSASIILYGAVAIVKQHVEKEAEYSFSIVNSEALLRSSKFSSLGEHYDLLE